MKYDVVIVGGGIAGLSAALTLSRARRSVLVVADGQPRNWPSQHSHGFITQDGVSPSELDRVARDEVLKFGGTILNDRATKLSRLDEGTFDISLEDGGSVVSRAVLVATGLKDVLPEIDGLKDGWGRDVVHCPYCHGNEVSGKSIAVLGGDNRPFTLHQAGLIRLWSDDVVFILNGIELTHEESSRLASWGVQLVDGLVAKISRSGSDGGRVVIALEDGRESTHECIFVGPVFQPQDGLLRSLGADLADNGWIKVDPEGRTSIDGVWGAGNAVSSPAQLITSASQGAAAAISINHFLLAKDMDCAVKESRIDAR